jgi:DNA-directed RNA polymerase specialized sigma24 family protein
MSKNQYTGIMDDWQVRMMNARARRMGLSSHDRDDVAQRVAIETVAFTSNPNRYMGAKVPEAVLATIVNRQVQSAARQYARYRHRIERMAQGTGVGLENVRSNHDLRLDVRMVVAHLSPLQQRICAMLTDGESIASIAKALHCGWHTVERLIASIRERFERVGLHECMGA